MSSAAFFESVVASAAEQAGFDAWDIAPPTPTSAAYRVTLTDAVVGESASFRVSQRDVAALAPYGREAFTRSVVEQVRGARRRVDQRVLGPTPPDDGPRFDFGTRTLRASLPVARRSDGTMFHW